MSAQGWKYNVQMLKTEYRFPAWASLALLIGLGAAPSALAFDIKAGVTKESGPFDLFQFGFKAYKAGQKEEAVEAYRYAAEKGHTASQYALATMYAKGDGVVKDDFEAFKIYSDIAARGVEPDSTDTAYFLYALMSLARYYRDGIPGSPVAVDMSQARQIYFQVASTFGFPEAQFQLARMLLTGEGGKADPRQAKKWLNLARKSGHGGAMAIFGNVLFQEGQTVQGLAYMTAALDKCLPGECPWMQQLQEQAFSLATEDDRRVAVALAPQLAHQTE